MYAILSFYSGFPEPLHYQTLPKIEPALALGILVLVLSFQVVFTESALRPIQSESRNVRVSVRPSV